MTVTNSDLIACAESARQVIVQIAQTKPKSYRKYYCQLAADHLTAAEALLRQAAIEYTDDEIARRGRE